MIADAVVCGEPAARLVAALPRGLIRDVYVVGERPVDGAEWLAAGGGAGERLERALMHLSALSRPPDAVVLLSADGSDDPAEVGLLLAPIRGGAADLVLGSPALGRRERGAPGWLFGERLAALMIRILYRQRYSAIPAYRAIRMPAWVVLALREPGFGYLAEMQIKAARAGLRVVEVPVHQRKAPRLPWSERLSALATTAWRFSYILLRHATAR
jgi:hypothetical protein